MAFHMGHLPVRYSEWWYVRHSPSQVCVRFQLLANKGVQNIRWVNQKFNKAHCKGKTMRTLQYFDVWPFSHMWCIKQRLAKRKSLNNRKVLSRATLNHALLVVLVESIPSCWSVCSLRALRGGKNSSWLIMFSFEFVFLSPTVRYLHKGVPCGSWIIHLCLSRNCFL